jgi:sensor histidine kinase YesM
MSEKPSYARKVYLINPKFQWTMIRWTMLLALLISAAYYLSNVFFFKQLAKLGANANLPPDHIFYQFVSQQQLKMSIIFLCTSLIVAMVVIGFGIITSHRIAGPIYRMCKHLNESDPKAAPNVKFREKDFFPELADSFNSFMAKMKN